MKNNKSISTNAENILLAGILVGVFTSALTIITLLYWQRDGLDLLEISFMSILAGFFLFMCIIPINIIMLNKNIKEVLKNKEKSSKRIYQILLSFLIGFIIFLIIDYVYFLFDSSIPAKFAESLRKMAEKNGDSVLGMDDFANLPFGVQNGILTFIFGLIGAFISLPFIKKDGILYKSENNWR
ncbi:hypothetical protein EKM05_05825 [Flavobacterium sp. GSP27]|uniref:hypothetical protein n=1 Tax=Flavobacterium sp. GSP27 TaxID=2497489 RepID=UPI000F84C03A|nr:hypothetical protein [Flavobacterium sp. GSP27]RTY94831.1 hypothetical protein EKL32_10230 [Flavobacterium sp. GSN2]RTZ09823.1 hypothetical protein EKM05_05825 [Flavobacterium sp. GSP27]